MKFFAVLSILAAMATAAPVPLDGLPVEGVLSQVGKTAAPALKQGLQQLQGKLNSGDQKGAGDLLSGLLGGL